MLARMAGLLWVRTYWKPGVILRHALLQKAYDVHWQYLLSITTLLMRPEVNAPFFFETHFQGGRHPHYGRFLKLESDRLIEMTCLTAEGTKGHETIVTVQLTVSEQATRLQLTHAGFPDEQSKDRHAQAWPIVLAHLDALLT